MQIKKIIIFIFLITCFYLFSCSKNNKHIYALDFFNAIKEGNKYIYDIYIKDNFSSEIEFDVKVENDYKSICKVFYKKNNEEPDIEKISICYQLRNNNLYIAESLNLSESHLNFILLNPFIFNKIILLKEPIYELKSWKDKEFTSCIKQIIYKEQIKSYNKRDIELAIKAKGDTIDEGTLIIRTAHISKEYFLIFTLDNKKGLTEADSFFIDLEKNKWQRVRRLVLKSIIFSGDKNVEKEF